MWSWRVTSSPDVQNQCREDLFLSEHSESRSDQPQTIPRKLKTCIRTSWGLSSLGDIFPHGNRWQPLGGYVRRPDFPTVQRSENYQVNGHVIAQVARLEKQGLKGNSLTGSTPLQIYNRSIQSTSISQFFSRSEGRLGDRFKSIRFAKRGMEGL